MANRKLTFDIDANSDEAKRAIVALRREYDRAVSDLKRQQGDIALFKAAQQDAARLERQIRSLAKAGGDTSGLTAALGAQRTAIAQQAAALHKAGIDTGRLSAEQTRLRVALDKTTSTFRSQSAIVAGDLDGLRRRSSGFADAVGGAFSRLGIQIAAVLSLGKIGTLVDDYAALQARLRLATRDQQEFAAANADVERIAEAARVPLTGIGELYTRLASATKETGVEQRKIAGVVEAVALSLSLSGAKAAEADSAMLQFSQAMASGVLRGDEFNSVNEAAPRLLQALAASLNVPVGALRDMAKEGQLTREVLIDGLVRALPALRREAETLPDTIGGALTRLRNDLTLALGQMDELMGVSGGVARTLSAIGKTGLEALTVLGANVIFVFKGIGREIGGIAAQLAALVRGDFRGFRFIGDAMKTDAEQARKELDAFEKRILEGGKTVEKAAQAVTQAGAERNAAAATQAAELGRTKEAESKRFGDALADQVAAQRAATREFERLDRARVALAEKNAARIAALTMQPSATVARDLNSSDDDVRIPAQSGARADLLSTQAAQRAALAARDYAEAVRLGESAFEQLDALNRAGAQAESVLAAQAREVAGIQDQALAAQAAEQQSVADEIGATVEKLKRELAQFEKIPLGIDVPAAEASVREARKRMQAILDGSPLRQSVALAPGGGGIQAKADGGLIRGPGSGTSDSILARLSNGEYVVRAAAVRKLGLAALNAINQGRLPTAQAAARKAAGQRHTALLEAAALRQSLALSPGRLRVAAERAALAHRARLPAFASGGLVGGAFAAGAIARAVSHARTGAIAGSVSRLPAPTAVRGGATTAINLTLPGIGTFETRADAAVADSLTRAVRTAALQHGRRA